MNRRLNMLCENHMFHKAYKKGKSAVNKYTAIYVLKNYRRNPDGTPCRTKLGISINAKLGKAVRRSRVKRLIRAAYGEFVSDLCDGYIIVISARAACFGDNVKSFDVARQLYPSLQNLSVLKHSVKES